ncbi:MAG: glycoside hydrolase family 2 protein [Gemmatimonadetes bacterium]|nr:glycoside hydrolase family 2 protein [Gemmatimonadota bacterium]
MAALDRIIRLAARPLALVLVALMLAPGGRVGAQSPPPAVRAPLDQPWRFREAGAAAWQAATVPGTVHTDLLAAGLIRDPFAGRAEPALQWIEGKDWEYATTLTFPAAVTRHRQVELVFQGLDTYADVRFDGTEVLRANNMFRTWRIDLTPQLAGAAAVAPHELSITFHSPIPREDSAAAAYPVKLPAGNDPHGTRVFTRKAAYQYGWDWGPRYVTGGIWRPAELHAWTGATLRDAVLEPQVITDSVARLSARASVDADTVRAATLVVRSPANEFPARSVTQQLQPGPNDVALDVDIPSPQLWWPNGMGKPRLYDAVVELQLDGATVDTLHRRIGLRTVELVTEPDSIGTSFYFRVNGVPVFMKGANVIPLDHFASRVDSARYRRLFADAAAAHMNMLRVWGGGIYEADRFYDLADEYGILIWQDFMFANAMYPGDPAFLANVRFEAADQVRRLRQHPSIALWCGNNEIREGWENWGWQRELGYSPADSAAVWQAYEAIFHEVLPQVVQALDPQRAYWPSSPSIGWGHAESLAHGDSHYWGVWWGEEPFEVYARKLPRFASEFGFQAYPGLTSIERFTPPAERAVGSPVLLAHQKHARGDELIRTYMNRWFQEPRDFAEWVYQSQLLQAEGIGLALEAHRRAMPRTMGTLFWQLNDTWPVVSWSSIDWFGQWKALQWYAARAFAPLLISPVIEQDSAGDVVRVYLVSDLPLPVAGRLSAQTLDFRGRVWFQRQVSATAAAGGSTLALEIPVAEALRNLAAGETVLQLNFSAAGRSVAERLLYFALPGELALPDPGLGVEVLKRGGEWLVLVSALALARGVELVAPGAEGRFEDNFFDLLPGETRAVRFLPNGPPPARLQVWVRSLYRR